MAIREQSRWGKSSFEIIFTILSRIRAIHERIYMGYSNQLWLIYELFFMREPTCLLYPFFQLPNTVILRI